jgi:hypothetical protein
LHLWSEERNFVRRVLEAEVKNEILRLAVQRLGQVKPTKLEICRERDRRTTTAKRAARVAYQRVLQQMLLRRFPGFTVDRLSTSMDLERSFGPVYARGLLRRGQSAFAVLGVNGQETQGSIDAALTFGILWLDACRVAKAGKFVVEGLKLFLPFGASALTRGPMAHLNAEAAKWQLYELYELEERDDNLKELDIADCGKVETRLVHSTDESATLARPATAITQVRELKFRSGNCDFFICGDRFPLSWAGVRAGTTGARSRSFISKSEIVFGVGAQERTLNDTNFAAFSQLCEVSVKCAIPRARATIRYGACIRNTGWNRWLCETLQVWTNAWIQPVCIRRFQRFLPPIAP